MNASARKAAAAAMLPMPGERCTDCGALIDPLNYDRMAHGFQCAECGDEYAAWLAGHANAYPEEQ